MLPQEVQKANEVLRDKIAEIIEGNVKDWGHNLNAEKSANEIISLIAEVVPDKKEVENLGLGYDEDVVTWRKGFNECRAKMMEALNEKD